MHVGQRISLHGYRGTVRYIGALDSSTTTWIGVEWDEKERGKHSGEHQQRQIFSCRAGHGTFLKQSKVTLDESQSFNEAIERRYVATSQIEHDNHQTVAGISRTIEAVGFDKVRERHKDVSNLNAMSFAGQRIEHLQPEPLRYLLSSTIQSCSRNGVLIWTDLTDLDLSWNLISDIQDVLDLCQHLPTLKMLDLEGNRFTNIAGNHRECNQVLHLQRLSINLTYMSWIQVLDLINLHFSSLNDLQCAKNDLSNPPCEICNIHIQELNLHDNRVSDLHQVLALFPILQSLDLSNNYLTRIIPTGRSSLPRNEQIRHLNLSGNALADISDVQNLSCYKSLESLQYTLTFDDKEDDLKRLKLIKYLPQLKIINRTTITLQERQDAAQLDQVQPNVPQSLSQNFVTLLLSHEGRTLSKRVLKSQSVKQMKLVFAKFAGLKPMQIDKLVYRFQGPAILLDDDFAQLSYYDVADGGVIRISA